MQGGPDLSGPTSKKTTLLCVSSLSGSTTKKSKTKYIKNESVKENLTKMYFLGYEVLKTATLIFDADIVKLNYSGFSRH